MVAQLNQGEICIKGNKYMIVNPDSSGIDEGGEVGMDLYPDTGFTDAESLTSIGSKLDKIIDTMGSGSLGGGYRSVNITLPPRERKYEVRLGILASQMHIRADQGLTINLNSESGEDIFIEIAEFPFSLSDLHQNEAITSVYFTTGANETNIKLLAIGMVR
jgi:hypothetical protein